MQCSLINDFVINSPDFADGTWGNVLPEKGFGLLASFLLQ
jgi:hypothetical protein